MYLLEEAHVATVGGSAFGTPECIRLSYAASEAQLNEALLGFPCRGCAPISPVRYLRGMDALAALQSTERVSVLVIGDVMLDAFLIGQVNHIEAPVPVVDVQQRDKRLGGAANVAKNLIALGAKVELAAVVGEDNAGDELPKEQGTGTHALLRVPSRPTTIKTRVISNGQQLLRVDEEQTDAIDAVQSHDWVTKCQGLLDAGQVDVVIFEDYDKDTTQRSPKPSPQPAKKRASKRRSIRSSATQCLPGS